MPVTWVPLSPVSLPSRTGYTQKATLLLHRVTQDPWKGDPWRPGSPGPVGPRETRRKRADWGSAGVGVEYAGPPGSWGSGLTPCLTG